MKDNTDRATISEYRWAFATPVTVLFGTACLQEGVQRVPWRRALLVTTAGMVKRGVVQKLREAWPQTEFEICDAVTPNPELDALDQGAAQWRRHDFEGVVALGGGSALDTGKVLGALLGVGGDFSLHRHFRENQPWPSASGLPVVAIPTTSGTGSEVTPFATVWDSATSQKFSLAGDMMFPRLALLDPSLTYELPWEVTVATGLDALCQAFESVWNRQASPVSLSFALRGAVMAWRVLQRGKEVLRSPALRAQMMEASLLAGLAISQTRTALCHAMSYPLTLHFGVPHGIACAWSMPEVLRFNWEMDDGRLAELVALLGYASGEEVIEALYELLVRLEIPAWLRRHGVTVENTLPHAAEMGGASRAANNLRAAGIPEVEGLIERGLDYLLNR